MKVGVFVFTSYRFTSLDTFCGGEYRYLLQIAECLSELDCDVSVLVEDANGEFEDRGIRFRHHHPTDRFDLIITQNTDKLPCLCQIGCPIWLFSMGNPDDANLDNIDRVLTYDFGVVKHCAHLNYNDVELIYPYVDEVQVTEKIQFRMITATTELYPHLRFHLAHEVFCRVKKSIVEFEYYYFYSPDWLKNILGGNEDGHIEYLQRYDIPFKIANPTQDFHPVPLNDYKAYQQFLSSSGFYLNARGGMVALAPNEAMFHGVCVIDLERSILGAGDLGRLAQSIDVDRYPEFAAEYATNRIIALYQDRAGWDFVRTWQQTSAKRLRNKSRMRQSLRRFLNEL